MKLLNKIPVLDKGWVALFSSSLQGEDFKHVLKTHYRGLIDHRITDMTYITLSVKCPLFVQLTFPEHNLSYSIDRSNLTSEAYIPAVNEIRAASLETSESIQQDIEQTTEALLINPKAYQEDGCDLFIAQVVSPISIYNTLLITGSLTSWIRYISQRGLPSAIEQYRSAIEGCLASEWHNVILSMRDVDSGKAKKKEKV